MSFDEDLIKLIDQRIRAHGQTTSAIGTCADRDVIGARALVLFDGATVAVPVKVSGSVEIRPGQRCFLQKFGTEWIVVGAFASPALGYAHYWVLGPNPDAFTSSSSFVDITGMSSFQFTKYHDATSIELTYAASGYVGIANTGFRWGIQLTQLEGETAYVPADQDGPYIFFSQANVRLAHTIRRIMTTSVPAGTYSAKLRFRRPVGTGNCTTGNNDLYSVTLQEKVMPASPVL